MSDYRVDGRAASPEATAFFFEIARCANVKAQFERGAASEQPCRDVINTQQATSLEAFQVPEPWCGDLEAARILFVSSNPSIDKDSATLWSGIDDGEIWDSHANLFFNSRWSRDGIYTVLPAGQRSKQWVRYWAAVRARARELLGREAVPGRDYALTEVVHCKSRGENGVASAQPECGRLYLRRVLALSCAGAVVVFGDIARDSMVDTFDSLSASTRLSGQLAIEGRDRIVLCLPHPNARTKRTVRAFVRTEELQQIQRFICA